MSSAPANSQMPVPLYWMNEVSGRLAGAVNAYLRDQPMTDVQISYMRAYLKQWMKGDWKGPQIDELRRGVDLITTKARLHLWLCRALDADIDPL